MRLLRSGALLAGLSLFLSACVEGEPVRLTPDTSRARGSVSRGQYQFFVVPLAQPDDIYGLQISAVPTQRGAVSVFVSNRVTQPSESNADYSCRGGVGEACNVFIYGINSTVAAEQYWAQTSDTPPSLPPGGSNHSSNSSNSSEATVLFISVRGGDGALVPWIDYTFTVASYNGSGVYVPAPGYNGQVIPTSVNGSHAVLDFVPALLFGDSYVPGLYYYACFAKQQDTSSTVAGSGVAGSNGDLMSSEARSLSDRVLLHGSIERQLKAYRDGGSGGGGDAGDSSSSSVQCVPWQLNPGTRTDNLREDETVQERREELHKNRGTIPLLVKIDANSKNPAAVSGGPACLLTGTPVIQRDGVAEHVQRDVASLGGNTVQPDAPCSGHGLCLHKHSLPVRPSTRQAYSLPANQPSASHLCECFPGWGGLDDRNFPSCDVRVPERTYRKHMQMFSIDLQGLEADCVYFVNIVAYLPQSGPGGSVVIPYTPRSLWVYDALQHLTGSTTVFLMLGLPYLTLWAGYVGFVVFLMCRHEMRRRQRMRDRDRRR